MELMQGTLDLLVLKALTFGARHGYAISGWIRERTAGELDIEDGALYHALHRLERQGLVASEWGVSEQNRRARFYVLTADGRARLRTTSQKWRRYAAAVATVLEA